MTYSTNHQMPLKPKPLIVSFNESSDTFSSALAASQPQSGEEQADNIHHNDSRKRIKSTDATKDLQQQRISRGTRHLYIEEN
jgi:hypothetical protein